MRMKTARPAIPSVYPRNVLRAISCLQKGTSAYIPADAIIHKVMLQMRRRRRLETVKKHVMQSLSSLTQLGILSRIPSVDKGFYQFPAECHSIFKQFKTKRAKRKPRAPAKKFISCKMPNGKRITLPRPRRQFPMRTKQSAYTFRRDRIMCTNCRASVFPCIDAWNALEVMDADAVIESAPTDETANESQNTTAEQVDGPSTSKCPILQSPTTIEKDDDVNSKNAANNFGLTYL